MLGPINKILSSSTWTTGLLLEDSQGTIRLGLDEVFQTMEDTQKLGNRSSRTKIFPGWVSNSNVHFEFLHRHGTKVRFGPSDQPKLCFVPLCSVWGGRSNYLFELVPTQTQIALFVVKPVKTLPSSLL